MGDEVGLCEKLKQVCDNGIETDKQKSAELLHKLGLVYLQKSPDKISIIQSAVLLNAAIVRKPENVEEIRQDLSNLCTTVLELAGALNRDRDLLLHASEVSRRVSELRQKVAASLRAIPVIKRKASNVPEAEAMQEHVRKIEQLQNYITEEYKSLMGDIMKCCIDTMSEPPCKFALVGMGSLARKEITPFSDFENIIVLEEGIHKDPKKFENILVFFRWTAVIFQLIIVNLGETIIPCMGLPYLNNHVEKKHNWFYDAFTPRGISFDGQVPYACKSPLGRPPTEGKPWTTELIKPVSEMLEYLQSDVDLKNGYHLADMLMKTCYVAGDKGIYECFNQGVEQYMQDPKRMSQELLLKYNPELTRESFFKQLNEDLENFSTMQKSGENEKKVINIKRKIYRPATLFLAALSRHHKTKSKSSFDQVRELKSLGAISEDMCDDLLFAVAIACEVRLKVYFANQGQRDDFEQSFVTKEGGVRVTSFEQMIGHVSYIAFSKIVVRLQRVVMSRVQYLSNIRERILQPFMLSFWFADIMDDYKAHVAFTEVYSKLSEKHKQAFKFLTHGYVGLFSTDVENTTPFYQAFIPLAKENAYSDRHYFVEPHVLQELSMYTPDEPVLHELEDSINFE